MNTTGVLTISEIFSIIMGLGGGLALFLFGMEQMTDALKIIAGKKMKKLLARLTTNRFKAAFVGAFVTAVIQSSSITTVLVVGFISVGLLTLPQSIGVIMGANIGSTITAQIIAFNVTHYALLLVAVGFSLPFITKLRRREQYGLMIMGLGLIFFGMELMSNTTAPLRTYAPFITLMQHMQNSLMAILISTLFTGLVQSSSATTGIIIVLAGQGFITLETGIALALGANLGTCITAVLAAVGKPREAVQAAMVHVLFNVMGILVWLGFIDELARLVRWFSPTASGLTGLAKLAAETPRQIANAHTVFNLINTALFIWLVRPLAWLVQHLIPPEAPPIKPEPVRARYLDQVLLETPDLALDRVRMEITRLGEFVLRMVELAMPTVLCGSKRDLKALAKMDDDVDTLYGEIVRYLGQLSQRRLLDPQSEQVSDYMAIANYIESMGDMIETNLIDVGKTRVKKDVHMSDSTQEVLQTLHNRVYWAVAQIVQALTTTDKELAYQVWAVKPEINRLADEADDHLAQRLVAQEPNRLDTFRLESDMVEYLKRVYYFAKRIAHVMDDMEMSLHAG